MVWLFLLFFFFCKTTYKTEICFRLGIQSKMETHFHCTWVVTQWKRVFVVKMVVPNRNTTKIGFCCVTTHMQQKHVFVVQLGDKIIHNRSTLPLCTSMIEMYFRCAFFSPPNCIMKTYFYCAIFEGAVLEYGQKALTWVVPLA